MTFPQTSAALEAEAQAAAMRHYQDVLHTLVDVGAALVEMVLAEARARNAASPGVGSPAAEAAVAYELISKSMRRSVMLARSLSEPVAECQAEGGRRRIVARAGIVRAVEDSIHQGWTGESAERLEAELRERMDAPELAEELGERPVAEIIADICRDLGLAGEADLHRWKRRSPAAVVELWAKAAEPGVALRPTADGVELAPRSVVWPCPEPPE